LSRKAVAALSAAGALSAYLGTLAPGLTWRNAGADGGELAAAAAVLGVAHPPGYPTFSLLAHLFTRLPLGEVATRTNLFSAACASGTVALLAWALARPKGEWVSALGAGTALAFSPLLWSQATITEVHALNALFAALLLALAALKPEAGRHRHATALALAAGGIWGLSLGNHPTALFCAPLAGLALWRSRRFPAGLIGLALGLSVYLYLPLRAAAETPINWGNPQTLEGFRWVVSGALYRPFIFSLPLIHLPARLAATATLTTRQFTAPGLLVAFWGGAALWGKDRRLFFATGATMALCTVFALGYNTTDSYLYLLPALVCLGLWLGVGMNDIVKALRVRAGSLARLGEGLIVALPLALGILRFPEMDLSHDRAAGDFATAVLAQAPPEAILLSRRDAHTFALWYAQYALKQRPDVATVDLDLLAHDWYADGLSRRWGFDPSILRKAKEADGPSMVAQALQRPVCQVQAAEPKLTCVTHQEP
jgi:hypothetical protein